MLGGSRSRSDAARRHGRSDRELDNRGREGGVRTHLD